MLAVTVRSYKMLCIAFYYHYAGYLWVSFLTTPVSRLLLLSSLEACT